MLGDPLLYLSFQDRLKAVRASTDQYHLPLSLLTDSYLVSALSSVSILSSHQGACTGSLIWKFFIRNSPSMRENSAIWEWAPCCLCDRNKLRAHEKLYGVCMFVCVHGGGRIDLELSFHQPRNSPPRILLPFRNLSQGTFTLFCLFSPFQLTISPNKRTRVSKHLKD